MSFFGSHLSWFILTIAILADYTVINVMGLFYPGYSSSKQFISTLGSKKSPVAPVFNIWMILIGITMCIYGINFYFVFYKVSHLLAVLGGIALTSFGIGTGICGGIFHFNEEHKLTNTQSSIHSISVGFGFSCLSLIPLIVGLISFKTYNNVTGIFCIILFAISLALQLLILLCQKELFKKSTFDMTGLWQRLLLACLYTPLFIIAFKIVTYSNFII